MPQFELLDSADSALDFATPIARGSYRKKKKEDSTPVYGMESFQLLPQDEVDQAFELVTPEYFDSLPEEYTHRWNGVGSSARKSICFIDGEGANDGEREITRTKHGL